MVWFHCAYCCTKSSLALFKMHLHDVGLTWAMHEWEVKSNDPPNWPWLLGTQTLVHGVV